MQLNALRELIKVAETPKSHQASLVLASARRAALSFAQPAFSFTVRPRKERRRDAAERRASCGLREADRRAKAGAVAQMGTPRALVLGADTTVVIGDEVVGKPRDREDSTRMFRGLIRVLA